MDTQIAAHALALGLPLVTHNTRHFKRVAGWKLEDWNLTRYVFKTIISQRLGQFFFTKLLMLSSKPWRRIFKTNSWRMPSCWLRLDPIWGDQLSMP
jgi:hypothetical protein